MKKKLLSIVMTIIILTTVILPISASAYPYGGNGKWINNPTYINPTTSPYYSNVEAATAAWNAVLINYGNSLTINKVTAGSTVTQNYSYYGATDWNATTLNQPGWTSNYTSSEIKYNRTVMDGYTSQKRTAICTHEWGHCLGLAHTTYSYPQTLMYTAGSSVYYDQWGIYMPTPQDAADVDSIY